MVDVRVRLLGGLEVEGRRAAEVGSRKARTLLAALALPPRRPLSADLLAELLWGDELPRRPADQVGVLVSRLRGVLGAGRIPREDAGYRLLADWVDVDELSVRTAAAQAHLAGGDALSARLAATMALDLARGPLLPEEDAEWFEQPRAAAARLVGAAGLVAAEAALRVGDPLGAAAAASLGLDHDPYDEAALRALMRAHVAAGRPASALAAYAQVRARLAEDLGVSPDVRTEALHGEILGTEDGGAVSVDGWDPLVQRARLELASNDLAAAQRDAHEAVRRGGGPGALELAGWTAYYARDFSAALRWAEEAAARTAEAERRASCLTLAGRIRHSTGDLLGAEARFAEAVRSDVAGVRAMAEVWLGSLRAHQGRPAEALELARRGAVDAAALRHPFVISQSHFGQVFALGEQGRLAEALAQLDEWDATLGDLGPAGVRYQPAAANFRAWVLSAAGRRDQADECSRRALSGSDTFQEPRVHALLDLARSALVAGDVVGAGERLAAVVVPADHLGTMVWHQRQRLGIVAAQHALSTGDPSAAQRTAAAVVQDARDRGARRAERLAEAVVVEARVRSGESVEETELDELLDGIAPFAGLERWRVAAQLAAITRSARTWERAETWAASLAASSGDLAEEVSAWTAQQMSALRS